MHQEQGGFKDYFWSDTFDLANVAIWGDPSWVLYLHGGLHLCRSSGRTKKTKGSETHNLLDQFGGGQNATPLFVTEGTAEDKMTAIAGSDYLTFAYSNLVGLKGPLCVFGHSLGELDQHIISAISKSEISTVAVSVKAVSELNAKEFKAHVTKVLSSKKLRFFDAKTHPLGADDHLASGGGV